MVLFCLLGSISLTVFCLSGVIAVTTYKTKSNGKRVLSSLHIFTLGVFLSTVLMFAPVYYSKYDFGDSYAFLRPALLSLHHAFRIFILDSDFDVITKATDQLEAHLHSLFSLYAAVLYVIAPILTFSNVLSLFKGIKNEIRFLWHGKRPFYIFSELNEKSITLAESIFDDDTIKKPVIVFTDVFEQEEEAVYEILLRAHDINAILLKKDIIRLNVKRKKSRVEFFLIGEKESENIEQAIKLTQEYNNDCREHPVSVFVYSSSQSGGYIIDSINKGENTLDNSLVTLIKKDPEKFLKSHLYSSNTIDSGFYIRRIDPVEFLVQQTLKQNNVIDGIFKNNESNTISIAILGMGSYGKEFLKHVLSLYQIYGYQLEINVFDSPYAENGLKKDLIKKLGHEWPEIIYDANLKSFYKNRLGDSNYDIQFFDDVDCFSTDFDRLFEQTNPFGDRLMRTQIVFVALGEDDKNIDAAVMLRSLFERIKQPQGSKSDSNSKPLIYTVVYDDRRVSNLNCNQKGGGIINYRGESFQIDFIGNIKKQYSYNRIKEMKTIEEKALRYHLDWLRVEVTSKEKKQQNETQKPAEEIEELVNRITSNAKDYMDYEYYRKSSIARAVHEELLKSAGNYIKIDKKEGHPENCCCSDCIRKSMTEHMRWSAYIRTLGYRYAQIRNDLAKTHNNLVPWHGLDPEQIPKNF